MGSSTFLDSEGRLGLDLTAIVKERQKLKSELLRELNAAEIAPIRNGAQPTIRETFILVQDDEDDVKSGLSTSEV